MHQQQWTTARQNQQNDLCSQRWLISAWAFAKPAWLSAQSDQSLLCPPEERLGPKLPIKSTAKTDHAGQMPSLIGVFAGHTGHFVAKVKSVGTPFEELYHAWNHEFLLITFEQNFFLWIHSQSKFLILLYAYIQNIYKQHNMNRKCIFRGHLYNEDADNKWAATRQNQQNDMCTQPRLRSA